MLQDVWLAIDERRYEQAETLLRKDTDIFPTRAGQMALGYLLAHTGRFDDARQVFGNLREQHQDDEWEHIPVHQLGRVERLAGQHQQALDYFQAERQLIERGDKDAHKLAVNNLETAHCQMKLGHFDDARANLKEAQRFARDNNDPETLGRVERGLADLCLLEGHPDAAKLHYERALVAFRESEDEFAVRELEALLAEM